MLLKKCKHLPLKTEEKLHFSLAAEIIDFRFQEDVNPEKIAGK